MLVSVDLYAILAHFYAMEALLERPRSPEKRKEERIFARLSAEDKAVISQAAAMAGQSVGSFMVAEARKAAVQTLESRQRIVLNLQQSRRLVEALLAPASRPTERMKAALRAYKATVKSDLD